MTITSLRIANFRNLAAVDLSAFSPNLNILCGNNGSGKTSFLEAIYYLSLGRSFRSTLGARLIRHQADKFSIFSQIVSDTDRHIPIGIEREENGRTRLRIAESDVSSITELAACLPVRLINSQSHHLFESGPIFRRKFIDWGLFYQSANFLPCYRQYERVLKQRNAVLRDRRPKKELDVWTEELIKHGLNLDALRREYVEALTPHLTELTQSLLGDFPIDVVYQAGWDDTTDLAGLFAHAYSDEMRLKHTQFGPHRADLNIVSKGLSVKHFLSRGQQKLLICAMIAAQGKLLNQHTNRSLIYLVDDLPAELDLLSRQKLVSLLSNQPNQTFITTIERDAVCDFVCGDIKVFHVEHGSIVER